MSAAAEAAPPRPGAIRPAPTPEEAAAIVAAIEVAWPKPVAAPPPEQLNRWRFSGRWWDGPLPLRRARPG